MIDTPSPAVPDEKKLRPANENPWYLLATLHGEQNGGDCADESIHAQNRRTWNRYIVGMLSPAELENLNFTKNVFANNKPSDDELKPFDEHELKEILEIFKIKGIYELPQDNIDFSNTIISKKFNASGFIFCGQTDFTNTIFRENAKFIQAYFVGKACLFGKAEFVRDADFLQAIFFGRTDFCHVYFKGSISFFRAIFKAEPPDFNGVSSLFDGTLWPAPDGWPDVPKDVEEARRHQSYYERLKKDADAQKKHRLELFFFSKELECQQIIDGPWRGWPAKLYGALSIYGTSIARPLQFLLICWFAATLAFWGNGAFWHRGTMSESEGAWLSLANLLAFLPIRQQLLDELFIKALTPAAIILSTVQALFGATTFFLIGLALRNRFRMK